MKTIDELWNELHGQLLAYIKSKVHRQEDAEDILQDVFVKVYRHIETLEKADAVKSWIYQITRNTIVDFYKKKKDISVAPETLYHIEDDSKEATNMNENIAKCLTNMIFDIPEKYHSVYELHEKKDMKHKEIAEALDISVSASKVRLKRAKDMFKDKLLNCCEFELDQYGNIIDYHQKGSCNNCNGNC